MKALITRKIGMANTILEDGAFQVVTLLSVEPHTVTQIKTNDKDGYMAAQVGVGHKNKLGKSLLGHFKPSKAQPNLVREFRLNDSEETVNVGDTFAADVFSVGDRVHVSGTSKGKGFAGTIRRHNFHRGRKTHGGRSYRRPGSIGSMYPQKIFKGKKMAGQLGGERVTVRNLKVALIDLELGVIGVSGAVPGPRKSIVIVKGAA